MKKVFVAFAALAVLAACTKETGAPADGKAEIKLASQSVSVSTKAPFDGTISGGNTLKAFVPVSETSGDYTAPYDGSHGYMEFKDNGTTAVGFVSSADWSTPAAKYYPADGGSVWLCGLYPHDAWGTPTTSVSAEVDGETDLMYAPEVSTSKADVQTGGTPKTLSFGHLLTRLNIELVAENADAKATWGKLTSLKLKKAAGADPANSVSVNLADGSANFSGAAVTECYTAADVRISATAPVELAVAPDAAAEAYVLCQPVDATAGNDDYTLSITNENNAAEYEVPLELSFDADFEGSRENTAGQQFTVTLTFKATTIQAKAEVAPWEEAGTSTGTIQ